MGIQTWDAFTNTPSRLTAEPVDKKRRKQMLQQAAQQGYIDNYSGVRISSKGNKFRASSDSLEVSRCYWSLLRTSGNF